MSERLFMSVILLVIITTIALAIALANIPIHNEPPPKPLESIHWEVMSDYHTYVAHLNSGVTCYRYSDHISCVVVS